MNKAVTLAETPDSSPELYENAHVHYVYNVIADHFSSTRYKPWPVVTAFLESISVGSVGLDAGTGNGKYLISPEHLEGKLWTIGLDRSERLLEIAKRAGGRNRECVQGDVLHTCWRDGVFDFAISIATIHHLSTPERRKRSVQSLLRCLSPSHGRALIYVWAVQQDELSKRSVPMVAGDEVGGQGSGQDVFVPWVFTAGRGGGSKNQNAGVDDEGTARKPGTSDASPVFNRYYHMFEKGELRKLILAAASELGIRDGSTGRRGDDALDARACFIDIVKDDWERSNFYVELRLYKL